MEVNGRRQRRWPVAELLTAAASVSVFMLALVAAEAAARHLAPSEVRSRTSDSLHRFSETYGWEPKPGARSVEDGVAITVNRAGQRGGLVPLERRPGRTRVVLVGDSIAFGTYVDDHDTFAAVVERLDPRLEVVNLAVQGYGPGQALLKLEREGLAYAPDLVVLNVCLSNDFADAMLPVSLYDGLHLKPYFTLEQGRLVKHDEHLRRSTPEKLASWLAGNSTLYRAVSGALAKPLGPEPEGEGWQQRRREALKDRGRAVETTIAIVARMRELATSRGAAFVVLLHPDEPSFAGPSPWIRAFREAPALEGVRVVEMARHYRRMNLAFDDFALDAIGHLNVAGHEAAARVLREVLTEPGLRGQRADDSRRRPPGSVVAGPAS